MSYEEMLKNYLENEEGMEVTSINVTDWDDNVFDVNEGEREYLVIPQKYARDYVRDDIESLIDDIGFTGSFTDEFFDYLLVSNRDQVDDFFYDVVQEEISYGVNDYSDDELVDVAIEEHDIDVKPYYDEETGELDVYGLREVVIEKEMNAIGDDYLQYCVDMFGWDWVKDLINEHWSEIFDLEDVVDECIEADGYAHFIARYDGEEIDLGDGIFAYRTN